MSSDLLTFCIAVAFIGHKVWKSCIKEYLFGLLEQVLSQWAPREDEPPLPPAAPVEETLTMPAHPRQSVDGREGEPPMLLLLIKSVHGV